MFDNIITSQNRFLEVKPKIDQLLIMAKLSLNTELYLKLLLESKKVKKIDILKLEMLYDIT